MKSRIVAGALAATMLMSALPVSAVAAVTNVGTAPAVTATKAANPLRVWYDEPANINTDSQEWQHTILPIGNGYMGGMVFGGISKERVHFNEKSMWSNGPTETNNWNGCNRRDQVSQETLNSIRERADDHSESVFPLGTSSSPLMELIGSNGWNMGMYQDFGDIYLDFGRAGISDDQATNYSRDIDLNTAVSTVKYDVDGVTYTREYLNSYPDNVLAMKLSASEAGKLTFDTSIAIATSGKKNNAAVAEGDLITVTGQLSSNNLKYETQLKVIPTGGEMVANEDGTISVTGADEVVLIFACGTDYKNEYPKYRGEDPHNAITERINTATEKGYDKVKEDHIADYSEIFSRVSLDLGDDMPDIPTDDLIQNYRDGEYNKSLESLVFQFGRYLTMATSREGTLPANLNGVWMIGSASQFWNADYHFNVNFEMNYWPTMVTNMAECQLSMTEYMKSLVEPGRVTAGASSGVYTEPGTPLGEGNGFIVHTVNDIFGCTAPYQAQEFGWNIGGSSWAMQNVYDYYEYTGDKEYLESTVYPMLKEMAKFWSQFLWYSEYQDRLVVGPSISAEQGPTTNGTTYDQSLVWEIFEEAIEASEVLGVDEEMRAEWADLQSQLNPIIIGDEGQVKEWYEETTIGKAQAGDLEEVDIPNFNAGYAGPHRHTSHLVGLYPGTLISKETPEWLEAAKVSLEKRGFEATGWSKAHKLNEWARTGDAENTYKMAQKLLSSNYAGIMDNLLGSHGQGTNHQGTPVFQIETNFGYTAGIAEMLLQSQLDYVQFLPTIPEEWDEGSVKGLVAQGNFEISEEWSNNSADKFTVKSNIGGTFAGEYEGIANAKIVDSEGQPVEITKESVDRISFETEVGETYTITFEASGKLQTKIDEANTLCAQMTDEVLANAKAVLDKAIGNAETVMAGADNDAMFAESKVLGEAIKDAQAAIDLNTKITETRAELAEIAAGESWSYLEKVYTKVYTEINKAIEVLTAADSRDNMNSEITALQNILTTANTDAEAATKLSDTIATGENKLTSIDETIPQVLVDQLKAEIETAKGVLATATTEAEFTTETTTLNQIINDIDNIDEITPTITPSTPSVGGTVTMESPYEALDIRFTLDGSIPTAESFRYTESFVVPEGTSAITAALFNGDTMVGKTVSANCGTENIATSATEAVASDVYANSAAYDGAKAVDGSMSTRWATNDGVTTATLELTFAEPVSVNGASITHYTSSKNKINSFNIEYWDGENWVAALADATIENSNGISNCSGSYTFDTVTSDRIRLNLTDCLNPSIYEFTLSPATKPNLPDRTKLTAAITAAKEAIENGIYDNADKADQEAFDAAYAAAVAVNENVAATVEQIAEAEAALTEAVNNLVEPANKTNLKFYLDKAKAVDSSVIESLVESAQAQFKAALGNGQKVYDDAMATQEEVNAAARELRIAIQMLSMVAGDKEALIDLIADAEDLIANAGNDYPQNAIDDLQDAIDAAKAVVDDGDAFQADVDKAYNDLQDAMEAFNDSKLDWRALEAAVEDATDNIIPDIEAGRYVEDETIDIFMDAYEAGKAMLEKQNPTQEEIDAATIALLEASGNLQYRTDQDWRALDALIEDGDQNIVPDINASRYVTEDGTVDTYLEALADAKEVRANLISTQGEIDEATTALLEASSNLRYKAEKGTLEAVIGDAENMNVTLYTASSVATFRSALAAANTVLADESLSLDDQAVVDNATATLEEAMAALVPINQAANDDTNTSSDDTAVAGDITLKTDSTTTTAKTGDVNPLPIMLTIIVLAAGTGFVFRKRKQDR